MSDVYANHLELPAEWDAGQRAAFLDSEAATMSYRLADLAAELGAAVVADWTRRHGAHLDYLTHVSLLNSLQGVGDGDRAA